MNMLHRHRTILTSALLVGLGLVLAGCHSTRGGAFPRTGGSQTYYSTDTMQKTITVVDSRTGEVYLQIDVPVGKQLSLDFVKDGGDDPVNTPDLMRYQIMDQGTLIGRLRNAMSVPNAASRRIEVAVRQDVEYADAPPQRPLRVTEEPPPEWWTPTGGEMDPYSPAEMYD